MVAPSRVHVVGGGVIGLACAWELSRNGHHVTIVAPAPGRDGASWVAAGMLAPVTEAQFGESALTALLREGARRWPDFAADARSRRRAAPSATTRPARSRSRSMRPTAPASTTSSPTSTRSAWRPHRRSASECRALVPALSPSLRGGIEVPGDHSVDNRALLGALVTACRAGGVGFIEGTVAALEPGPALVLADGRRLGADHVVLAAGTGLPAIGGLEGARLPPLRAVKGHILRLGPPPGATAPSPLLARTVRGLVHGRSVYLVPRRDGSLVVGATVEERGFDTAVRAGAVHELLCDARAVVPGIDELELLEAATGLRPATPDNTPRIGWTGLEGVAVATVATTATASCSRRSPHGRSSTSWPRARWRPSSEALAPA